MTRRRGGYSRHWFTVRGAVGLRRPNCDRCRVENPKPLTPDEQSEWDNAVLRGWVRA